MIRKFEKTFGPFTVKSIHSDSQNAASITRSQGEFVIAFFRIRNLTRDERDFDLQSVGDRIVTMPPEDFSHLYEAVRYGFDRLSLAPHSPAQINFMVRVLERVRNEGWTTSIGELTESVLDELSRLQ